VECPKTITIKGLLTKLLSGGISFDIPVRESKGVKANQTHDLILGTSFKDSLEKNRKL
jgi:paraquat-inducible protein B